VLTLNFQDLFKLDTTDVFRFAIFGLITTPPNFAWQAFLERQFPSMILAYAKPTSGKMASVGSGGTSEETSRLSIKNTVAKFFLDQTLGCWINTLLFILLLGWLKGKGAVEIENEVRNVSTSLRVYFWTCYWKMLNLNLQAYWSMVLSSYQFWPLVTLTNFVLIPARQRILVGNLAGLIWGTYVNIVTAG